MGTWCLLEPWTMDHGRRGCETAGALGAWTWRCPGGYCAVAILSA